MTLIKHTRQAYILTMNIITIDNGQAYLQQIPIVRLTRLILAVWAIIGLWQQGIIPIALTLCEAFYLLVETCKKPLLKTYVKNYGGAL